VDNDRAAVEPGGLLTTGATVEICRLGAEGATVAGATRQFGISWRLRRTPCAVMADR
jgi:hypothetical protein